MDGCETFGRRVSALKWQRDGAALVPFCFMARGEAIRRQKGTLEGTENPAFAFGPEFSGPYFSPVLGTLIP